MLLVAAYWRTNLPLRQLAPLFGVSKSVADRIVDHLGPALALQPRRRFRRARLAEVEHVAVSRRGRFTGHPLDAALAEHGLSRRVSAVLPGH